ncbi:transcription factor [Fusarium heterosporum]|uniref:Transcription factor n=1 Tax=Fusarium heterosporum TaxID=42747 RepID=A0A8H5WRU3_FUSHE|nr:transcription factor [Fusarium heterosporum]
MISSPQQNLAQPEPNNFFQRAKTSGSCTTDHATKIRAILQDARTIQKLAQSHDIEQFLNQSTTSANDDDLSDIAALAGNISRVLDEMVHFAPRKDISPKEGDTKHKRSRSPKSPKRCHNCGVTDTPRWRRVSPGCPLLCNVCSLVQSKRAIRRQIQSRAPSVMTRFSWPA